MKEGELFAELIDERRIWFSTFDHPEEAKVLEERRPIQSLTAVPVAGHP